MRSLCIILSMCWLPGLCFAQRAPWIGETLEGMACIGKAQGYGPFDYTQRYKYSTNLKLVEEHHFNRNVERLVAGVNSRDPLSDLDYTLRAWPNHHRALNSAIRFRLRYGKPYRLAEFSPAECYLQRAVHFAPKDGTSHMLYGMLLDKLDHNEKALAEYRIAEELNNADPNLFYNMGLLLFEMKKYDQARIYAEKVYSLNFPLQGLRNKLRELDQWKDVQ